ncbi:hypothetical protein K2173_017477 [Erythroxylum novogranatense]|uniref:Beta-galactosidase n=1 Tax=Erythroxylum novogranatense TaxID=1862640 RepID=A0AAV8TNI6_9ROSI|nr:hypothetical protein K2173_017477 [Erythroxylum novogranatense]
MTSSKVIVYLCLALVAAVATCVNALEVLHDGRALTLNGKRRILLSGAIHYPRSTAEMWPDLIKKSKEGGLDAIETYVFWNAHEPARRQYNFEGNLDLIRFLKTIQKEGLYAILRIGPYVCAEWNYGGFPVWLHNLPGVDELRTTNSVYMNEMQNFTTLIVDMVKKEKLLASQGGPIIIAQIENEYGNVQSAYGAPGKAYVEWCSSMADSQNIGVPWIMCQQNDAPEPMLNTCNGWYCDSFSPNRPNSPKMWTENWTGWFKSWGGPDPHRTAEDVAFSVARFFQRGGTFQNYYMYHGGTNFGRTSGGPYLTTTYDYDAPLDEYGNIHQPKYGHLKQLHDALHSIEEKLTEGNVTTIDYGNSVMATIYTTECGSSCFLGNANATSDATVTLNGIEHTVPAWSVSILPDCQTEVYNTAKVNTQTSVMGRLPNEAECQPDSLKWSWRPENLNNAIQLGKGQFSANRLIDQKNAANDASDYMWYITNINLEKDDPVWCDDMTLRINATGHVLHIYLNGEYIDSEWATYGVFNFVWEKKIKLNPGKNSLALLSVTVGFQNYGPKFDLYDSGIKGPVQIIGRKGDETIIKDLSGHKWNYIVGLQGLDEQRLYSSNSSKWNEDNLPNKRMMTWFKTTFKAPLGSAPVVVDLEGLGKGLAWVNGNLIGRYWPSYLAKEHGCDLHACDYRGPYNNNKCVTGCGEPSQRWYHVPRSWLKDDGNSLVLFEEFGGHPSLVNFRTVEIEEACLDAYMGNTVELSCQGKTISNITTAIFGNPLGTCGSFEAGTGSIDVSDIIAKACVGKERCTIEISEEKLGHPQCGTNIVKKLAVDATCSF